MSWCFSGKIYFLLIGVDSKLNILPNINRFPMDFMFELNDSEFKYLRSQIATTKREGTRYAPMVFTEQGVAMLSSVLNSETAIRVNIEIIRAFVKYRGLLRETGGLQAEIKTLDEKINKVFKYLLERIDALHQSKKDEKPRKMIGYINYEDGEREKL